MNKESYFVEPRFIHPASCEDSKISVSFNNSMIGRHVRNFEDLFWGRQIVPLEHENFLRLEHAFPMFQDFWDEKYESLEEDSQINEEEKQNVSESFFRTSPAAMDGGTTAKNTPKEFKSGEDTKDGKKPAAGLILPIDFQPLPYTVIVGKGKESKHAIGNQRLRVLASNYLQQYAEASDDKRAKSDIVSVLVATVRNACPLGAFVRLGKDGRWYEVSEAVAREKVGYTFRELLGDRYRSSSKAKAAKRSQQKRNSHPAGGQRL